MRTVTLKQTGYYVTGISDLTMWGGGNACIEMKAFEIPKVNKKILLENINDNGFGVSSINGAVCNIYVLYENGYKEFQKQVIVGNVSDDTKEYHIDALI